MRYYEFERMMVRVDNIIVWISLVFSAVTLVLIIVLFSSLKSTKNGVQSQELIKIETLLTRLESVIRTEISTTRTEQSKQMTDLERSLITKLLEISRTQQEQLLGITNSNNETIDKLRLTIEQGLKDARTEQSKRMADFETATMNKLTQISNTQQAQLKNITDTNNAVISRMSETVDKKLDAVKSAVESKLKDIQNDNSEKLEKMRQTVDEKLHKTLEERLGQSFKLVSERLEQVQKGLGEMQNLAVGVGDLKKVLTNVKTRGIMGEIQLESILEQILSAEQYGKNVRTNPHSSDVVEFAIKLPGKDEDNSVVYLPIDSKFPMEAYYQYLEAYDRANMEEVERLGKAIEAAIKKSAKDIHDKYIYPPNTTEFGVMFLPVEGLYAEVVRRPQLLETLQREYKIIVTGPTTLAALLNSLQMGFRTLAIEKRSSEVWKVLSAVKTEFNRFGDVLERAQKKISDAGSEIDKLVGVRSRKIIKQLSEVSELKQSEADKILLVGVYDDDLDENETA